MQPAILEQHSLPEKEGRNDLTPLLCIDAIYKQALVESMCLKALLGGRNGVVNRIARGFHDFFAERFSSSTEARP